MTTFDRFSDRAQLVLRYAQEEAQRFNHTHIGTEHLLLGLIREGESAAAVALTGMGLSRPKARAAVEFIVGRGEEVEQVSGLTRRAKATLELALEESSRLGHDSVGPEHVLLAMIREGDGIGLGMLKSHEIDVKALRTTVLQSLGFIEPEEPAADTPPGNG
jgi:ATP-dependent Clp protease ATP-binding subunit ClpC